MKIAEALAQSQSSSPKMKLRDALMQVNPSYVRAKKAEEARINSEKALAEAQKYAESAKFWETIAHPSGALKSIGTEIVGTTKAVGADIVNVLTPWDKTPIQEVQFGGKTFQTPSAKGAEAGLLAREGQYKKAAGKLGESVLDIVSTVTPASITIKALKAGSILRAFLGGGLATAPIGAGYGATGSMQEGAGTGDILKQSAKGAGIAFISGGTLASIPGGTKAITKAIPKIEEVIGKLTSKETKILETELTSGKTPEQAIDTVLQSRPFESVKKTDVQVKETVSEPKTVFRGRDATVDEADAPYRFFTESEQSAGKYADIKKTPEGKSEVISEKIDASKYKLVDAKDYLDELQNKETIDNFDGVKFKEPNGEMAYAKITKEEKPIDTSLPEQPKPDVTPKKESGYAKSLETKAVEKKMASEFQDLAEYTPSVRKEQAQMTTKLINEDIEKVNSILDGKAELPSGMRGSSLALAVEQHAIANNDVKLLQKLAKSKIATGISEAGSELSMLSGRNANSPVRIIRSIAKARRDNVVKRLKGKKISEARKQTKESIRKAIKKEAPTKETWVNFISEIKC